MTNSANLGRDAASPAEMPAKGWLAVLRRVWKSAGEHNLGLIAAGVAFYGFLALVPLLGALVMAYGLIADPAEIAKHMQAVGAALPRDAAGIIQDQLKSLAQTAAGKKGLGLAGALALALYGAMQGAKAVMTALNVVNGETEKRGFLKINATALGITAGAVLVFIAGLLAASLTGLLEDLATGIAPWLGVLVKVAAWAVTAALAAGAVAAIYRYAPSRDAAQWRWLTPGSALAMVGFVVASVLFGLYAAKFGNYNKTYGALGGIVVMLMWLYLSGYVLLFGGSLNAELERQTARDTTRGPERPLGKRQARPADEKA